jgi:diguanylate cyclase (GGDEF)-like protein
LAWTSSPSSRHPIRPDRTSGGAGRRLLPIDQRQELEVAFKNERPLGMLLIEISGYTLFQRLYGLSVSSAVTAKLDEAVRVLAQNLFGDQGFMCSAQIDASSSVVLLSRDDLDVSFLVDAAVNFRLGVRNRLHQDVVQLTGQHLPVEVGYSLLPRPNGRELESLLYHAVNDAAQVARGNLDYSRLAMMSEFRDILERPLLTAHYQPIVNLKNGEVLGWEALARGPEDSQFRSPSMLFDFAEEVGSLFNLERVCREQAVCNLGPITARQKLFLNIHPRTLGDPTFRAGETVTLLERHGLVPDNVVFEITERHSVKNFTLFHQTLDHYRSQGYLVAIDDTGTGYSGLSLIAQVRPNFIKVDMSLIRDIDTSPIKRALLETLVTLADKIGSAIIAEGIETETELSSLASMGVHYGQGFYLARPARPKPEPDYRAPYRPRIKVRDQSAWKCSIPIVELCEAAPSVDVTTRVAEVKNILDQGVLSGVVVVRGTRPVGLVMSHRLDRKLGTMFGAALYLGRSVDLVMDHDPLIADGDTPVEQVARQAMARDRFKIYDHVIVTQGGQLAGLVSVQKILDALARVQVEMAKGANPLTGLPGGMALEWEIERRCTGGDPASFIYVDLDNFKVYNDTYGWNAGDKMIRLVSRILTWAVSREGGPDSFLGHVGGDDFVLITSLERAEAACRWVTRAFSKMVRVLYRPEDRHRGFVEGKDRNGQVNRFPLVSVSLAIVDCVGESDLDEVAKRSAEVKTFAKSQPGNVYVRDRRGPLGQKAATDLCADEQPAPATIDSD